MSRRLVSKFGGIEDCRRVKSVWEVGDCASSCCCRSGSVAVDAEVDKEPELPPSVVTESARLRDDESVGNCASASVVGVEEDTDSERFVKLLVDAFLRLRDIVSRSLREAWIAPATFAAGDEGLRAGCFQISDCAVVDAEHCARARKLTLISIYS